MMTESIDVMTEPLDNPNVSGIVVERCLDKLILLASE